MRDTITEELTSKIDSERAGWQLSGVGIGRLGVGGGEGIETKEKKERKIIMDMDNSMVNAGKSRVRRGGVGYREDRKICDLGCWIQK